MHRFVSSSCRSSRIWIAVVAVLLAVEPAAVLEPQTTRAQDGAVVFVRPTRRAPDRVPAPLPDLPPRAEGVQPLTFDVVTRRTPLTGPVSTDRQRVSRTRDRIHLAMARTEWLFARNPVDPRRVSALLVHHASRSIVSHEESDLRNTVGINGWAAVLMLGLDPDALRTLTPTAESRRHGGLEFQKHTAASKGPGLSVVWWNPDHLLPLSLVVGDASGTTNVTVERLKRGVAPALLGPPSMRFPDYTLVDLAQWLEGH